MARETGKRERCREGERERKTSVFSLMDPAPPPTHLFMVPGQIPQKEQERERGRESKRERDPVYHFC